MQTQADSVYFYPSACLGNWQNPDKAQGPPDLQDFAPDAIEDGLFNVDNSAFYEGGGRQILCGGFTGDLPRDIEIEKISLRLVWVETVGENSGEPLLSQTVPVTEEEPPLLVASETAQLSETEVLTSPAPLVEDEAPVEPNGAGLLEDSVDISPPPHFSNNTELQADEDQVATFVDDGTAAGQAVNNEASSSQEVVTTGASSEMIESFFIIRYSFDGLDWEVLAEVNKIDPFLYFDLPLDKLGDLSNLRFSVESTNQKKTVYLDGMALKLEYQYKDDKSGLDFPDFDNSQLISIKSSDSYSLVLLNNDNFDHPALWLYDRRSDSFWQRIDTTDYVKEDGPIALKDNYAFWLSGDGLSLIGFNISANNYFSQSIDSLNNPDLSFDINNLAIQYLDNAFILKDKSSDEARSLDDSWRYNEEVEANFEFLEPGKIAEATTSQNIFEVNVQGDETVITVMISDTDSSPDLSASTSTPEIVEPEEETTPDSRAIPDSNGEPVAPDISDNQPNHLPIIADIVNNSSQSAPEIASDAQPAAFDIIDD